ncbi:AAA family ATPase [Hydrogenivirga sp. 128-5-R1-1]|uniref:AAA family ATPase n=1 Tax=Hydrogenivirga sp. 128-5-R1-1 TaxID=392423 RepID=UPI00015F0477|nr:AAA family ATPase [Hydrogenivirga sp. 128-5-R1-1]EDP74227.1 purine NTPase [Hydrogenivirga sp. 128-5-R1-1]
MILKSLYLENFLAHEETKLNFAENGITVLIGDNGAGKSSILEAIQFALYGSSSKGNISQLVKWGRKKAKIELEFIKNGSEYKIEREIVLTGKSHSQTAVVYKKEKGNYRLYYQKNINKELPKITGITQKTFLNSILVKQGEIEGLLELTPKKRAQVFEELLEMSLYQLLSEKYGEKRRQIEKEINAVQSSLPDEKEIKEKLSQLKEEKNSLEGKIKKLKSQQKELEEKLKEEKNKLNSYQKEKEENLKKLTKIKTLEEKINFINKEIAEKQQKLKEIEEKEKLLPELEKKYNLLKEKENLLKQLLEAKSLQERLSNLLEKEKEHEKKKQIYEKYKETAEKYEEYKEKLKKINENLNQLTKLKGELNALTQQIDKTKEILRETKQKALEKAKQLIQLKTIFKTLELNPVLVDTMIKDENKLLEDYQSKREELLSEYKSLKSKTEELNEQIKNISKLEGNCPTCARPLKQHSKEEIIKDLKQKITKLQNQLKDIENEGKKVKEKIEIEKKAVKLLEEFKNWYEKHKEAKKEKEELQAKIRVLQLKLKDLNSLEKEKEEVEKFLKENENSYQLFLESKRFLNSVDIESIQKQIKTIKEKLEKIPENINQFQLEDEIKQLKESEKLYVETKKEVSQKQQIASQIEKLQANLENLEKETEKLRNNIKDENQIQEKINRQNEKIEKLEKQSKEVENNLNPEISKYGYIQGQIENLEKQLNLIEENLKKIKEKEEKLKKYRKLEEALGPKGIQKVIRDSALYQLPILTEKLFKAFGFNFNQVKFTENFDISLQVLTYEKTDRFIPVSAVSGGQKVALGLALRLALSHFLGGRSEFLILDEPTVHLDSQRKEELINILLKLKEKNYVKQLLVVTHDREIEDAADQIYYIEKGKVKEIA